jgi:hypothetical protein
VPPSILNVVSQTGASDARAAIRAARVRERCEAAQRLAAVQRQPATTGVRTRPLRACAP